MAKSYVSQCIIVCSVLDTEAEHQGFSERRFMVVGRRRRSGGRA